MDGRISAVPPPPNDLTDLLNEGGSEVWIQWCGPNLQLKQRYWLVCRCQAGNAAFVCATDAGNFCSVASFRSGGPLALTHRQQGCNAARLPNCRTAGRQSFLQIESNEKADSMAHANINRSDLFPFSNQLVTDC